MIAESNPNFPEEQVIALFEQATSGERLPIIYLSTFHVGGGRPPSESLPLPFPGQVQVQQP